MRAFCYRAAGPIYLNSCAAEPSPTRQKKTAVPGSTAVLLQIGWSWPISRVLSWTTIPLGLGSLPGSSNLPAPNAGHANGGLFGLAPGGVYRATNCYQSRGALLPHPFTLTCAPRGHRRSALCCTGRRLTPPRCYLAPCPMEPGLSSPSPVCQRPKAPAQRQGSDCLANSRRRIIATGLADYQPISKPAL